MTAEPTPVRGALAGAHADTDDLRAVLREVVDQAMGPLAGRATATVDEIAELLAISRASAFEGVHAGTIPSLRIGRRILIPLPAIAAALLGAQTNGETDATKAPLANGAPVLTAAHRTQPDERTDPP
jgi:excisionase family DNA binding protein